MKKLNSSKLYKMLSSLSWKERKAFMKQCEERKLPGPLHHKVLDRMESILSTGDTELSTREFALKVGGKGAEKAVTRAFSEIGFLLKEYLIDQKIKQDQLQRNIYWAQICAERNWSQGLDHCLEDARNMDLKGWNAMLAQLQVYISGNHYASNQEYLRRDKLLPQVLESLDSVYLLQKFKYLCAQLNAAQLNDLPVPRPEPLDELFRMVLEIGTPPPAVQAYIAAYRLLKARTAGDMATADENYARLMAILNSKDSLSAREASNLIVYALNHQIRKVNQNQANPEALFSLIESMRERGTIMADQLAGPRHYKMIAQTLCNLGKTDEADAFVEEFQVKIAAEFRAGCYAFNKAAIAFHRKEWAECRRLLFRIEKRFHDPWYDLGSRIYLCKSDFYLEDWVSLGEHAESFRVFIYHKDQKSRLTKDDLEPFKILQRYLQRVVKVEPDLQRGRKGMDPRQIKALDHLIAGLEKEEQPRSIQWLLDHLKGL